MPDKQKDRSTSWGEVAPWYHALLEDGGSTYQRDLILPALLRILGAVRGVRILDIGSGQGFFSRAFHAAGASVSGVDISPELVELARKSSPKEVHFSVAPAETLPFPDASFDRAVIVLALQNIRDAQRALAEAARVLIPHGRLVVVLNHPSFRVPRFSGWGWDAELGRQYRRVDRYLSEIAEEITMHPGEEKSPTTLSFHRPLQYYAKALTKSGFSIVRIEEWNSHKMSEPGPRARAENRARKEIPLFLCIEARRDNGQV